jgi:hypothetical protein
MLMNRNRVAASLFGAAAVAASVLVPAAPAQAVHVDLHAPMRATSAYPNAHGGARYEAHHGWREFELHLRGIRSLAGSRVTVTAHGSFVGKMKVTSYGTAHLRRHNSGPRMHAGDVIRVRTKSGKLVSRGTLRRMHHHM